MASSRLPTKYPGVFYRVAARLGGSGDEKVYYIVFKKAGRVIEEKAGRQYADDMTPARAASIRAERIEGKRQSRKELREEETEARRAEAARPTLDRLWEAFQEHKANLKSLRDDRYRYQLHLAPALGGKVPGELITLDIARLRSGLEKAGKSPQLVKHVLVLLKRIINFGVKHGLCPAPDPSRLHFDMPTVDNIQTEFLTPEQLSSLLRVLDEDANQSVASMMKLAIFTGMRRGELFSLKWEDIDFQNGFITIGESKGGKTSKIPLNAVARSLLLEVERTESPHVFPGRGGNRRNDVRRVVDRIKKKAGLPDDFRPMHGLRHTYASMLASSGVIDLYTLQKLLTHKSSAMTQRYAHLQDEALKRASEVANKLFQNVNSSTYFTENGKDSSVVGDRKLSH